ncbi:BfmA/BtgA family mobilization protein [Flavivirga jejuensis]|uniref:BfmA/BtgA family mobilization protein n=1 Tax=Flavivirga jejuensis TaxID=870487 RepID=A0ABT8WVD7_9FLAO|nr:BfmA/BtgA family mobilization protein [Flavivirga jejuensis]MDO5977119.1 BfmA/BtgA family mobilization protein [Flavivirga jejuensis]
MEVKILTVKPFESPLNIEKSYCKMNKKKAYKNRYSAISIKKKVAKRFRLFSKKIAKSHSDTLVVIMDFFEWHGFSPSDRFEKSVIQEVVKNRKRMEASIAIIKDIEKSQTKPTTAMLQSLFEEKITQDTPEIVERKFVEEQPDIIAVDNTTVPKIRYEKLEHKIKIVKGDFNYVLGKITPVKSGFGKAYLKLELTSDEIERFRRTLKNI